MMRIPHPIIEPLRIGPLQENLVEGLEAHPKDRVHHVAALVENRVEVDAAVAVEEVEILK